jgi:hypothetical protein
MTNFQITLPIVLYMVKVLDDNQQTLHSYLFQLLHNFGIVAPKRLLISILIQPIIGVGYQSHYQELYPEIKKYYSTYFHLYCPAKIISFVNMITNSMVTWKILLFQAKLVKANCPRLLHSREGEVLDIDGSTLKSCSSKKEGAEIGFNKKAKGKPCFQLSASFIGRIFVELKLFAGHCNPKVHFQKAVKRAKSLGLPFEIVRADSAYLTLENLLFLFGLSLGYAIGAPGTFSAVKKGIRSFKVLARKKFPAIIPAAKGVALLDLGWVTLSGGIQTRLIIVRRISRRKNRKTGKWKMRTYYYAIASNLKMSPLKLFAFYHKRQCIEAGFRELKNHYHLERLPFKSLKANEFWIACKLLAMTLFKIFQTETLSKAQQSLLLKTFMRKILLKGLRFDLAGKVEIIPRACNTWLLRRLMAKTEKIKLALIACKSIA